MVEAKPNTGDKACERREWTAPRLDVLEVAETATGGTSVIDNKGGGDFSS